MTSSSVLSARSRRKFVTFGLVAGLALASPLVSAARAQDPAAPAAQEPKDPLKFNLDVPLMIIYPVLPNRAADFEATWTAIREGLMASEKQELKDFGATLVLQKVQQETPPGGPAPNPIYVFYLPTPSKTMSYNPVELLYKTGIFDYEKATAHYNKLNGSYTGIQIWPLAKIGG